MNYFIKSFMFLLYPLMVILLITFLLAGFKPLYYHEFNKYDISAVTGMDDENLKISIEKLSGYVIGKYDKLNHEIVINGETRMIYNQRELDHMVDVRNIFDKVAMSTKMYFVFLIFLIFYEDKKKRLNQFLNKLTAFGVIGSIVIIGALAIISMIDFSQAFIKFHEMFFTNDLWILNPETDVLIQMLPEGFFYDFFMCILAVSVVYQVITVVIVKWRFSKEIR